MSFFGTDGIRGRAGEGKLTDENLVRMAAAIGAFVGAGGSVVIGRDTRESGPHFQRIITEGLIGAGVDVVDLGILPTPATALWTQWSGADLGIMITASHNPWHDNGVKIFAADGRKLPDGDQAKLEGLIGADHVMAAKPGKTSEEGKAATRYLDHILKAVDGADLSGLTIVADGANGSAFELLSGGLRALGADVISIGGKPDGRNINADCGSTRPEALRRAVLDSKADVGFAMDGDADRILAIDNTGAEVDGDQIVARLALDGLEKSTLTGGAVVSTVMANLGLERWAAGNGLQLARTPVGDRHVAKRMAEIGANIGGEPSGHILLTDLATTGDGCLTALCLAASLADSGQTSANWLQVFEPVPQVLKSVRYGSASPLSDSAVAQFIEDQHQRIKGQGRILVRASGTEPVIRVMAEGDDAALVSDVVEEICAAIAASAQTG